MNILLLHPSDFFADGEDRVRISDHRSAHILSTLKATIGSELKVGVLNGLMGTGIVTTIEQGAITCSVTLNRQPPSSLPLTLICALPRPKSFKRALLNATMLGIKTIYFIASWRVEKSYWQSPVLHEESINRLLYKGLEQARDTIEPKVYFRNRFRPFIEDELPAIVENKKNYIAHPYDASPCPAGISGNTVLIIGPEGGFIPFEIEQLKRVGGIPVTIGKRILRVETAIAAFAGRFW